LAVEGRAFDQSGGFEGVLRPRGRVKPGRAPIGDEGAVGSPQGRENLAQIIVQDLAPEAPVSIMHQAAGSERAIGQDAGAGQSSSGFLESLSQADGLRVVFGVEGEELARLAPRCRILQEAQLSGRGGDLKGAPFSEEDGETGFQHRKGGVGGSRDVQLPSLRAREALPLRQDQGPEVVPSHSNVSFSLERV
jgi:hypothetical protein